MTARALFLGLAGAVLLHGSWVAAEPGQLVIDDLGHRVTITKEVKKIVSLVPSNSEMVCLLDCARLKAGTRYDRFPEELLKRREMKEIAVLGGGFDLNLEQIVAIGPDLTLANGRSQERVVLPLKNLGYPVLSFDPRDIAGVKRNFLLLGAILGEAVKAQKMVAELESRLKPMDRPRAAKSRKVYLQTWSEPLMTVGKDAFADELLGLAGGVNIFSDMRFNAGRVSLEWIIQRDPEVLIFLKGQEAFVSRILKRPEWRLVAAVRNRHFCFVDSAALRPTIQFPDGVERLHRCLFPPA